MPPVIKQSNNWDYQVDTVPFPSFEHEGRIVTPKGFVNVRRDTGEEVGKVSSRYGLVQNSELLEMAEDAFSHSKLGKFDKKVIVLGEGEKMFASYTFKDKAREVKVGDEVGMRLTVQNSFDGTLALSFAVGAVRLVCTNGMVSMEKDVDLSAKHHNGINISFIVDAIKTASERFNHACEGYAKLTQARFDHEKGFNVLNRLAKSGAFSERVASKVKAIWASPDYKEDEDRTLWNLYNATTQYLTREVEGKRYKNANDTNLKVLRSLSRIANTGTLNDWLVPLPVEGDQGIAIN
jgi:hypothetical protein